MRRSFFCLWLAASAASSLFAQEQTPPSTLIAPKLTGIAVFSDPKYLAPGGVSGLSGVRVIDVPFLDRGEFKERMGRHLGRPLTQAGKIELLRDIVRYYREHGRPIVDVSTPPQEVRDGVIQIRVLEGEAGKARVEGNRFFNGQALERRLHYKPDTSVDTKTLADDLEWLNRNPFRQVDLVYAKGAELGKTDLILRVQDRFPLRVYGGYEDSGTALTDQNRLVAGLNWGDVFGGDGQLNYQFMADPPVKAFKAHSAGWVQPLPWRHILTVFGSYVDTDANVPPPFTLKGFNEQLSARYEIPLPHRWETLRHSITAGVDYKRANNNLAFGGAQVFGGIVAVSQADLIYSASVKDGFGSTTLRGTYVYSPGLLGGDERDENYNAARAGATARYHYGRAEINRVTGLPYDFSFVNLVTLQISDSNLLASEQIGFGGYDTVRGYDTRVVNTDNGYLISTELRAPSFGLLARRKRWSGLGDKLQALGFVDYGCGSNRDLLAGEASNIKLLSVGPGLRYSIASWLSARFDYGWQLLNALGARPYASRSHIGVTAGF